MNQFELSPRQQQQRHSLSVIQENISFEEKVSMIIQENKVEQNKENKKKKEKSKKQKAEKKISQKKSKKLKQGEIYQSKELIQEVFKIGKMEDKQEKEIEINKQISEIDQQIASLLFQKRKYLEMQKEFEVKTNNIQVEDNDYNKYIEMQEEQKRFSLFEYSKNEYIVDFQEQISQQIQQTINEQSNVDCIIEMNDISNQNDYTFEELNDVKDQLFTQNNQIFEQNQLDSFQYLDNQMKDILNYYENSNELQEIVFKNYSNVQIKNEYNQPIKIVQSKEFEVQDVDCMKQFLQDNGIKVKQLGLNTIKRLYQEMNLYIQTGALPQYLID